ncbi:hypothetical protein BDR03DRAFT_875415, partial [Suillus americanus]
WTYGERVDTTPAGKYWVAGESAGWKPAAIVTAIDSDIYKLLISGIVARPMAFVSTISEEHIENLKSFSWFYTVMNYPPVISFVCNHTAPSRLKDTIANLKNTQGFTVSIMSESFVEDVNATVIDVPPGFDEWTTSNLTKEKCVQMMTSCVKKSAFSMECELYKSTVTTHPVTGEHSGTLILRVVHVNCI